MSTSPRPPIVVGLDGSDAARGALDWALISASHHRLPVHVLHAWSIPLPPVAMGPAITGPSEEALRGVAQTLVDEAVAHATAVAPDVEVTTELRTVPPAGALIDASKDASTVVVGSRGLSSFAELLVGSVSLQVATHAACPVAVIRPHTLGEGVSRDAGRVIVGVDGSELSHEAARVAFQEASMRRVGVTVLHAWDAPGFGAPGAAEPAADLQVDLDQEEQELVSETIAGLREQYPDVDVEQRLVQGRTSKMLVDASRGAELVVVGSRGRGGFASLMLGSVSHAVLHHAHAPVLIVRPVGS